MIKLMPKLKQSGVGAIPIIFLAALGLIIYLLITGMAPFQDRLNSILYPKPAAEARGPRASANLSLWQGGSLVTSVAGGSTIEVKGAGFRRGETVYVGLQGYFGMTAVVADSTGNFSLPWIAPQLPGSYSFVGLAYRQKTWTILASTNFTVNP